MICSLFACQPSACNYINNYLHNALSMSVKATKQVIDLTQQYSNPSDTKISTVKSTNVIDLTFPLKEEALFDRDWLAREEEREEEIKDKLYTNSELCDIRRVNDRAELLLELWCNATTGDLFQQKPGLTEAESALKEKIHWFYGVNVGNIDLYADLVDFTVYDRHSSGSGTGKRCVDAVVCKQSLSQW